MASPYRSVAALLISVFLLLTGNGLLGTLVPLGAKIRGYSELEIGFLGSAYFVGMLIGAIANPWAVRHSGHARVYTAAIAIAAIATLGFAAIETPWVWIILRGVIGFCFAGLYATVESWLQGKTDNAMRGRVLAVYSVVQYGGWAVGNQMLQFDKPDSFRLFSIAAAFLCAAIVPLTVTTQDPPERPATTSLPILWLLKTSPIGVIGVFLIGMANGPFWTLGPVFAVSIELSAVTIGTMMTAQTLGSAALQIPIGRLSDTMDRRMVLIGLALAAAGTEVLMALFGAHLPILVLYLIAFVLGSVISTQYYVLAAHTNDRAGRERAVGVASVLLFAYCVGAIIGPVTGSELMALFGPGALYFHNATVHLVLAAYVLWRILMTAAPKRQEEIVPIRSQT